MDTARAPSRFGLFEILLEADEDARLHTSSAVAELEFIEKDDESCPRYRFEKLAACIASNDSRLQVFRYLQLSQTGPRFT